MSFVVIKKKDGKYDLLKKETREILGTFDTREEAIALTKKKFKVKKKTGPKPRLLDVRDRQAIKNFAENGGNMGKALKDAGFPAKTADNPGRFFNRPSVISEYVKFLDKAGLTDEVLAQGHKELSQASRLSEFSFPHSRIEKEVEKKDGSGTYMTYDYIPVEDKIITKVINSISGCKLIYINTYPDRKIAYYTAPEHAARKSAYEMAYKNKGHFAPEHISLDTHHELTPEERKELDQIYKNNE